MLHKNTSHRPYAFVLAVSASGFAAACGGGTFTPSDDAPESSGQTGGSSSSSGTPEVSRYTVGGTVTGLRGTGLVLRNNEGDDLPIAADGSFAFSTKLARRAEFEVSIATQPSAPSQTCRVSGGTGTVASGDVATVTVDCATDTFTVGGTVSGLEGSGLVLRNGAGDDVTVNANGTFAFPTAVASGAAYAASVVAQPGDPTQTCTIAAGTGSVDAADVTAIAVVCSTNTYTVGGTVTGLRGTGLVLRNGNDEVPMAADGTFVFPTSIASGQDFSVTVATQPTAPLQTCIVSGGTGTLGASSVSTVVVNCDTEKFSIGGTVSGLEGTVVLQINGGEQRTLVADGTFAFPTPLDDLAPYAVTVQSQPGLPSQTCTLANAAGTVSAAAVTNLTLTCVTRSFAIKGTVTGLRGSGLTLENAGVPLAVAADGSFQLPAVESGKTYAVTVGTQPIGPSQTCTVTNGTGTVGGDDVSDVVVTCSTNSYTVGGSIAGLSGSGLVLRNNAGDAIAIAPGSDSFQFPTPVESGRPYAVTVQTQPGAPTQTCTVAAGTGTVSNGNVVTVAINCTTNQYAVGGTASGVAGTGLVLQNNLGADLTVNGNGTFAFAPIASGAAYSVTVKTQPTNPSQTCTVTNGSGTVGSAAIADVAVTCVTRTFTVGGTLSGLSAGSVVLQVNGANDLTRAANGAFTFGNPIASGAAYNVTVMTQPAGLNCVVSNGSGVMANAAITNVSVSCTAGITKWSEGTNEWPDQACNPINSFGGCDTNAQNHADAWATYVCRQNGYASGVWTGNKAGGCNGPISMYCEGAIPCQPSVETTCNPGDQTKVEIRCL